MANVTINDNTKYVELRTLCEGDYFISGGELYIITEEVGYYDICYNLSDGEEKKEIENDTKVLPVPSNNVKIMVEI